MAHSGSLEAEPQTSNDLFISLLRMSETGARQRPYSGPYPDILRGIFTEAVISELVNRGITALQLGDEVCVTPEVIDDIDRRMRDQNFLDHRVESLLDEAEFGAQLPGWSSSRFLIRGIEGVWSLPADSLSQAVLASLNWANWGLLWKYARKRGAEQNEFRVATRLGMEITVGEDDFPWSLCYFPDFCGQAYGLPDAHGYLELSFGQSGELYYPFHLKEILVLRERGVYIHGSGVKRDAPALKELTFERGRLARADQEEAIDLIIWENGEMEDRKPEPYFPREQGWQAMDLKETRADSLITAPGTVVSGEMRQLGRMALFQFAKDLMAPIRDERPSLLDQFGAEIEGLLSQSLDDSS